MIIQDIFLPAKLSSYYLFRKRVLSFEITASSVQATLIYFAGKSITLENSMHIVLQDHHAATLVHAIKKIATTIGKFDQVITSLSSSAVVFKDMTLPFIGRSKLSMIIGYEVESLLPFSLDQAVIDFLIVDENYEKQQTTVLIAAARKVDVQEHMEYFEKAGVHVTCMTLDIFALYDFYYSTMYASFAHINVLLVDFGLDALRLLYIQRGVLKSVRLVPHGLVALAQKADHKMHDATIEQLLQEHDGLEKQQLTEKIIAEFLQQLTLSISFFQKQVKNFAMPSKIVCFGQGVYLHNFLELTQNAFATSIEIFDTKKVIERSGMQVHQRVKSDAQQGMNLIVPLATMEYSEINFLVEEQRIAQSAVLYKQLLAVAIISILSIVGIYFYGNYELQKWNSEYERSRKQIVTILQDQMDLDIKTIRRVNEIVAAAQAKVEQTKKVCLSFSQKNHNYLDHLQELCTKIDRRSLGLQLHKLSLRDEEVMLQGKIGSSLAQPDSWRNLSTFTEELMELKNFTLKNIPAELSFNITLLINKNEQHNQEG